MIIAFTSVQAKRRRISAVQGATKPSPRPTLAELRLNLPPPLRRSPWRSSRLPGNPNVEGNTNNETNPQRASRFIPYSSKRLTCRKKIVQARAE
jgi:hypothetical protein